MKDLFHYVYYRIVRYYKYWDGWIGWDPEGNGMILLFASISYYILSILVIILNFYEQEPSESMMMMIVGVGAIIGLFFASKKLYNQLDQKYKNETNQVLKGWLVFAFVIGGFLSFFISLFIHLAGGFNL